MHDLADTPDSAGTPGTIPEVNGPARPDEAEEEPIKLRKRPPEDSEMDITPMIDVTFLLLIFFLVTSKVGASGEVPLPYAHNGIGVSVPRSLVITIVESGDGARVFLGDGIKGDELAGPPKDQEDKIIAYIRDGMSGSPPKDSIVLKAAKNVKHREVARVAQAVARAGGEVKLYAAVLEEEH